MFDSGFSELLLIFVLGLLVFGPERLPGIARTVGTWVSRGRSLVRTLSQELERELEVDKLRKGAGGIQESVKNFKKEAEDIVSQKIRVEPTESGQDKHDEEK